MINGDLYGELVQKARFALNSRSRNLVYEAHGMAKMAFRLGGIDKDQFHALNDALVVHGLNDPQYCRDNYGGVLE